MGQIPETLPGRSPAEQVFEFWRARQKRPDWCKLTKPRRKLIERALRDYEARDLCALVAYAYEADEPGPRFWRGDNRDGRTYLDLTNLLSDAARLPGRVEAALAWVERMDAGPEEQADPTPDNPVAWLRALADRAPGEAVTTPQPTQPSQSGQPKRTQVSGAVVPRNLPRW